MKSWKKAEIWQVEKIKVEKKNKIRIDELKNCKQLLVWKLKKKKLQFKSQENCLPGHSNNFHINTGNTAIQLV